MPRDVSDGGASSDDLAYLQDMLDACDRIGRFIGRKSIEDYRADELLRSGVERQIEIVGEAARRVSDGFRDRHPEIAWRPIIAQRHILAHEYGDIENDLIWRVATLHVPHLAESLRSLIPPKP